MFELQTGMGLGALAFSSFLIGFSGAVMPGPVLAVTITHSVRRGMWTGAQIVAGHGILEVALLAGLLLGLGPLFTKPLVAGIIGGAGGAIMLLMGLDMLRGLPRLSLAEVMNGADGGGRHPVWDGMLLSAANPYFIIWWATVGMGLLLAVGGAGLGLLGVAVFYVGHICADLAWYMLVSTMVSKGRRWLSDRVYKALVGGCAAVLVLFAMYFGVFAWGELGRAWA